MEGFVGVYTRGIVVCLQEHVKPALAAAIVSGRMCLYTP